MPRGTSSEGEGEKHPHRKVEAVWPVRLIVMSRAVTIGLAYYFVIRLPGLTSSFVAILGALLSFDILVALEHRRHAASGIWRVVQTVWPRARGATISLMKGLALGLAGGLLQRTGLPYFLVAVATAGAAYTVAEMTPGNAGPYVGLIGALTMFERVAGVPQALPHILLPAVWPLAFHEFWVTSLAILRGLAVGTVTGSLTRLALPRAYRSRQSEAYRENQ